NYGDGTLRAVRLTEGGEFGETVDLAHTGSGPVADRQSGPHAHFSAVVDDHLIVADLGTDELRVYPLESGRPAPDPILVAMPAGSGPRHFLRRGNALLVAGELDGTVTEVELGSWRVVRTAPVAHPLREACRQRPPPFPPALKRAPRRRGTRWTRHRSGAGIVARGSHRARGHGPGRALPLPYRRRR